LACLLPGIGATLVRVKTLNHVSHRREAVDATDLGFQAPDAQYIASLRVYFCQAQSGTALG
jgi:hypothetical protein